MKKTVAIALLFIHLFSIGGPLVMHRYFAYMSDKFFNAQTSKGLYNINDLTEVKLPVNMPNIADWKNYENITGQIQFENVSYNYVKMKITRTALYLMCVPDYNTTRLAGTNIIDAKQTKGVPIPKKDHIPYAKTTLLGQFNYAFSQYAFSSFAKILPRFVLQRQQQLPSRYRDIPRQPPKFFC